MKLDQFQSKEEVWEWLQAITDSVYNCIIAIDNKGKIILFNEASEKLLDKEKEIVLGNHIKEIIPETRLIKVLKSGEKELGQRLVLTYQNKKIYSNRSPIVFDGKIVGAIAVFQNITKIQSVRNELQEVKDNLNVLDTMLNEAYEAIVIVDSNGKITKFNNAYEEFLGVKGENVLGKHITDVIENTRMHKVVKTGKKELGHVQRIQGNEMVCSRIPIEKDGEIVGAIGKVLFKDVKELMALSQKLEGLENKLNHYKSEIKRLEEAKYSFDNILTKNKRMKYLKKLAKEAAESKSTVLIEGESGTGKELFAHAIHKASYRKYASFIRVNCAAIPENLLESELFGYEEGAFTGAKKEGKPGKFELADGGTIFLDEIGTMPLEMQVKLLRVLQEEEVQRVGGNETIELDVRVIAATNEKLEEEVNKGNFREDLYYRLNVIRLYLPPLRDRLDDIPLLAKSILADLIKELEMDSKELAPQTIDYLMDYDWPGNVRELSNFIERGLNLASGDIIFPEHLPNIGRKDVIDDNQVVYDFERDDWDLQDMVAKTEIDAIKRALNKTGGNRTKAAKLLGIHRTSFYEKVNRYGIDISHF
ncbi:sigma-54 interaction domain-containing protein [Halanaerobaculum tunisiense]